MHELKSESRCLNLKSTGGILGYLGGAWGLASAKRRAERKNQLPLLVVILFTVSCLCMISTAFLLGALHNGSMGIARLEQSRRTHHVVEQRQLEQVYNTERWIDYVAYLCVALNGAVVVSLFAYFAKGTPQRLKRLSQNAANISKSRGLVQAPFGQDVVEDVDMALQVLATALTEAEEREKLFRERESLLQKQLAEKYPDRKAREGAKTVADFPKVIPANVDSHLAREMAGKFDQESLNSITEFGC